MSKIEQLYCDGCGKAIPYHKKSYDEHMESKRQHPEPGDIVLACSPECCVLAAKKHDWPVIEIDMNPALTWPPQDPDAPTQFSGGFEVTESGEIVPDA